MKNVLNSVKLLQQKFHILDLIVTHFSYLSTFQCNFTFMKSIVSPIQTSQMYYAFHTTSIDLRKDLKYRRCTGLSLGIKQCLRHAPLAF